MRSRCATRPALMCPTPSKVRVRHTAHQRLSQLPPMGPFCSHALKWFKVCCRANTQRKQAQQSMHHRTLTFATATFRGSPAAKAHTLEQTAAATDTIAPASARLSDSHADGSSSVLGVASGFWQTTAALCRHRPHTAQRRGLVARPAGRRRTIASSTSIVWARRIRDVADDRPWAEMGRLARGPRRVTETKRE